MDKFQPSSRLELSGNVATNWRRFSQQFNLYLVAIEKSTASDDTKNAILLTIAGTEAIDVFNTFQFNAEDKVTDSEVTDSEVTGSAEEGVKEAASSEETKTEEVKIETTEEIEDKSEKTEKSSEASK